MIDQIVSTLVMALINLGQFFIFPIGTEIILLCSHRIHTVVFGLKSKMTACVRIQTDMPIFVAVDFILIPAVPQHHHTRIREIDQSIPNQKLQTCK
jgi:hypothetical protein